MISKVQSEKCKVKSGGFTLVELLISITIIAILTIIALASYSYFQKSARDAKRQSDLKFIQSALEQFRADQGSYPAAITVGRSMTSLDGKRIYMITIPDDPKANPHYAYAGSPSGCDNNSCTSYCLYTQLETLNLSSDSGCTPLSPYNYGVTKP